MKVLIISGDTNTKVRLVVLSRGLADKAPSTNRDTQKKAKRFETWNQGPSFLPGTVTCWFHKPLCLGSRQCPDGERQEQGSLHILPTSPLCAHPVQSFLHMGQLHTHDNPVGQVVLSQS